MMSADDWVKARRSQIPVFVDHLSALASAGIADATAARIVNARDQIDAK